jgi:hypothetical protein
MFSGPAVAGLERRSLLARRVFRMAGTVEHPDIRYVVYPVHLDGTPTGDEPRLRHDPDCRHFEWGDGTVLGTPELATEEQMRTLRACKTCIGTRHGPRGEWPPRIYLHRTGGSLMLHTPNRVTSQVWLPT